MGVNAYFAHRPEDLAEKLAENVRVTDRASMFSPVRIVVPGPEMRKWVQLCLAAENTVSINLQFEFLEEAIWNRLCEQARYTSDRPKRLTKSAVQLMVLSLFLSGQFDSDPEFKPAVDYIGAKTPGSDTRSWQLADRLAGYFLEYEYQRPGMIKSWLKGELQFSGDKEHESVERCQSSIYRALFAAGGLVDSLGSGRFRTLPQLADEVLAGKTNAVDGTLHVFAIPHMAPRLLDILFELGKSCDIKLYCQSFANDSVTTDNDEASFLVKWNEASADMKLLLDKRLGEYERENVGASSGTGDSTLLSSLQCHVLGKEAPAKAKKDESLQIAACPGMDREVETVYNSIIDSLKSSDDLRPTDIAVLVTDMAKYAPAIRSVFSRHLYKIPFSLVDSNASQTSVLGQAMLALMNLAEGELSRRDVFRLVSNPCFLAAAKTDRETSLKWLNWCKVLGIYRGFDGGLRANEQCSEVETEADGSGEGSDEHLHTWQQGLRRLRLGRIMDDPHKPAADDGCFMEMWPHWDMDSRSPDVGGKFSECTERLFFRVERLRDAALRTCAEWAEILGGLMDDFLAVPQDRAPEAYVRRMLREALAELSVMDDFVHAAGGSGVPFAVVREFVSARLVAIPATYGKSLTSGITVSSISRLRMLPFKEIYVLGLGEGEFPGTPDCSTLDLRRASGPQPGDLDVPANNRQMFLETLMSARGRLHLSYVSRDCEKDEDINPCSLLCQLLRYLGSKADEVPLLSRSTRYVMEESDTRHLANYSRTDRLLSLRQLTSGNASFEDGQNAQVESILRVALNDEKFTAIIDGQESPTPAKKISVTLKQLKKFLENPAEAAIKRHLGLYEDEEDDGSEVEDEPFSTAFLDKWRLFLDTVQQCATDGLSGEDVEACVSGHYRKLKQKGLTPAGVFAEIECEQFSDALKGRVDEIGKFFGDAQGTFVGNVSIGGGEAGSHCNPQIPPVVLKDVEIAYPKPRTVDVEISGSIPLLMISADGARTLGIAMGGDPKPKHFLDPFLFYVLALCSPDDRLAELSVAPFSACINSTNKQEVWTWELTHEQAREYLRNLVTEYIHAGVLDDIPIAVVASREVPAAWTDEAVDPDGYSVALQVAVDEDTAKEKTNKSKKDKHRMELLDVAGVKVPSDAYDKVRRRLTLFFSAVHDGGEELIDE